VSFSDVHVHGFAYDSLIGIGPCVLDGHRPDWNVYVLNINLYCMLTFAHTGINYRLIY